MPIIGFGQNVNIPDANFKAYLVGNTAIEYFTALTNLLCHANQLTDIDVSQNTALTHLDCNSNQLTNLDVSGATALTYLHCASNQLTSLNVSNNTALIHLYCYDNQLTSLDLRNGNNFNNGFNTINNTNLYCIDVDDAAWSTANWTVTNGDID